MALKRFDVSDIDDAISDAEKEAQQRQDAERADKLADAIGTFIEKSPVVVNAMKEIAQSLMPGKFSSQVNAAMKRSAGEAAELFKARVKPTVEKMETSGNRIPIPGMAVYITIISLLWLFAFLALVIYANTYIQSDQLTVIISSVMICWIVTVALLIYLTRKFKW